MFKWWIENWRHYLLTRFGAIVYFPCAAFLVAASTAGGQPLSSGGAALSFITALTLLLQFRLLDDLCDIAEDRRHHPDRVLVRAKSLLPFRVLLGGTFAANLALAASRGGDGKPAALFLALSAFYLVWYGPLRRRLNNTIVGYHVVVAKYPAFVFLLSREGGRIRPLLLAMLLVFCCFAIYEALHSRKLHTFPGIEKVLIAELAAFLAVSALMVFEIRTGSPSAVIAQIAMGATGFLLLAELFGRRRIHIGAPGAGYLVFVIAFMLIVNFSIGART